MNAEKKVKKLYTEETVESIKKEMLQSIIQEWHESKFQKPLIEIVRERLNEVKCTPTKP